MLSKTNQEKQTQKALASTLESESARIKQAEFSIKPAHGDDDYVEKAVYRVGEKIREIMERHGWNNLAFLKQVNPDFFKDASTISRLTNHENKRIPNVAQLFGLRRVFEIDLNALADGKEPFEYEQMSNEQLISKMVIIASELQRRQNFEKRQK